jgi:hypothetical protein
MATFTTKDVNIDGTCRRGTIDASYHDLCECFGESVGGDGDKTDTEWHLLFEDGTVATIYNWKNGRSYCGSRGLEAKDITTWNIGGNGPKAAELVISTIPSTSPRKNELKTKKEE